MVEWMNENERLDRIVVYHETRCCRAAARKSLSGLPSQRVLASVSVLARGQPGNEFRPLDDNQQCRELQDDERYDAFLDGGKFDLGRTDSFEIEQREADGR